MSIEWVQVPKGFYDYHAELLIKRDTMNQEIDHLTQELSHVELSRNEWEHKAHELETELEEAKVVDVTDMVKRVAARCAEIVQDDSTRNCCNKWEHCDCTDIAYDMIRREFGIA